MEEPRDANSPDSSGAESPSPSLPSPPILPLQAAQQAHRTTNFFIDNILRPDFGCKKELARERAQSSARDRDRDRGGLPVVRPAHPGTPCQDSNCSSDSTSSSSAASSLALSPSPKKSSGSAAEDGSGGGGGGGGGGGAKFGDTTSSSSVVLNGTGGSTTPTPETQPLLWPAWVYCTRYSDRPSSGKTREL